MRPLTTTRRKKFWTILLIVFVFAVGLTGGAYLVLRSSITQGTEETSTALNQGKSSDELLGELLKLNQEESGENYEPPEDKNLTEGFLKTLTKNGNVANIDPTEIASNDFFASAILPYLKTNQLDLAPIIPDSVLKIVSDSKTAQQKYYKDTNADINVFYKVMNQTLEFDADAIDDAAALVGVEQNISKLGDSFENLSAVAVPQSLVETHKEVLVSVFSLQKFLEAILNSETDPLKSLLVVNESEALGELWKQTLYDYVQLPEEKRK